MDINLKFMQYQQLENLSAVPMRGRLLSFNHGKNVCVGVIHMAEGYAMFNYSITQNAQIPLRRGDIITFEGCVQNTAGKTVLLIQRLLQYVPCNGVLPNKQFKGESDIHRILPTMFTPDNSFLLKLKASVMKHLRTTLYENGFDEIQTPVLYSQHSPSSAKPFSVVTINGATLYLKTIHEHLLKPYLLVGFDRIFEIGSVFRNIQYAHQFDCEFTNADIWMKGTDLQELIRLCISLSQGVRTVQDLTPLPEKVLSYDTFVEQNQLGDLNRSSIKHYIREHYRGILLVLYHYPRVGGLHTKPAPDGLHNEEFHVYANGISYAHGYLVNTVDIHPASTDEDCCQLFEKYAAYGIEEFGGVGIGLEKLLQAMLDIEDYHKLNLYRRKY